MAAGVVGVAGHDDRRSANCEGNICLNNHAVEDVGDGKPPRSYCKVRVQY